MVLSLFALSHAIPSRRVPRELKRAAVPAPENIDDLKDGEDKKDLEGSESAYHGYYGGWPGYYGYPSYSSYYSSGYWPYAHQPYSYWW